MSFQYRSASDHPDPLPALQTLGQMSPYVANAPAGRAQYMRREAGASVPSNGLYRHYVKRLLDVTVVLMSSVPVAVTVFLLALLVALDGHKPWYFQNRVGRNGRVFRMFKLRTMVVDADAALAEHLAEDSGARIEWDHHQKLRDDPRITRIGRLLRRSSLDELPQLWNVLIGDMSIVGPRPMMESQRTLYPGIEYFSMRPGITGFWQISARNETSFCERAKFDRAYFREMSLATDVRVIAQTFRVVLRATGH